MSLVVALAVLAGAPAAAAAPPRAAVQLEVAIASDAAALCPGREGITQRLGARLGYLPEGGPDAALTQVTIDLVGGKLIGTLRIERSTSAPRSTRLEAGVEECAALFDSIALALALAIDPLGSGRTRAAATSSTAVEPSPAALAPAPAIVLPRSPREIERPRASRAEDHASLRLLIGAVAPFAALRRDGVPAFGPVAGIGWASGALELDGEAIFLVPQSWDLAAGQTTLSSLAARAAACWRTEPLSLCGVISAGAVFGSGEGLGQQDRSGSALTVGLGPRLALDLSLGDRAGIRIAGTIEVMPARAELQLGRDVLWTMPVVQGELALMPWMVLW